MNKQLRFLFCYLFLFFPPLLDGEELNHSTMCPVHEAFFSKSCDEIVLTAVLQAPPQPLKEELSESLSHKMIWIDGYWKWIEEQNAYVWISGTWRLPPPHMDWIPGKWVEARSGWVWNPGFWYPKHNKDYPVLESPPPSRFDEQVSNTSAKEKFWLRGEWRYDQTHSSYTWYQGRWVERQENWVLSPSRYVWRDEGFVYVPAYWDWRLEDRGEAYSCIWKKEELSTNKRPLEIHEILAYYYPCWPDYAQFFEHFSHFYPRWDFGWGEYPSWWLSPSWWAMTHSEMWALWWWWSHPGYPAPYFMTAELAQRIVPPGEKVVQGMKGIIPPFYVTKDGVLSQHETFYKLKENPGFVGPFVPASEGKRAYLSDHVSGRVSNVPHLRPTGNKNEIEGELEKPFIGPESARFMHPSKKVKLPRVPTVTHQSKNEPLKVVRQKSIPKMSRPDEQARAVPKQTSQKQSIEIPRSNHEILDSQTVKKTSSCKRRMQRQSQGGYVYDPYYAYMSPCRECMGGNCSRYCGYVSPFPPCLRLNDYDLYKGLWGFPTSRLHLFEIPGCRQTQQCYEMKRKADCIKKYDKQRYPGAYYDDYIRWVLYYEWQKEQCKMNKERGCPKGAYQKKCQPKNSLFQGCNSCSSLFNEALFLAEKNEVPHFAPYQPKGRKKETGTGRIRKTSPDIIRQNKA